MPIYLTDEYTAESFWDEGYHDMDTFDDGWPDERALEFIYCETDYFVGDNF